MAEKSQSDPRWALKRKLREDDAYSGYTPTQVLVALAIMDRCSPGTDNRWGMWASHETIARDCHCNEKTVRRAALRLCGESDPSLPPVFARTKPGSTTRLNKGQPKTYKHDSYRYTIIEDSQSFVAARERSRVQAVSGAKISPADNAPARVRPSSNAPTVANKSEPPPRRFPPALKKMWDTQKYGKKKQPAKVNDETLAGIWPE